MNKTELMQVRDALSRHRAMGRDANGNYTIEVTPKPITDAIALIDADLARELPESQLEKGMMALLQCAASDLETLSPKVYEGYKDDVTRVHNALNAELARVVEPVAYVHFAKKKPDVKVLSWQKQVSVANKALGFVSEPLYTTPQAAAQPSQAGEVRLWDSQWVNVSNHDNCYQGWSTEDAVFHAVSMTEKYIAENVAQNKLPPPKTKASA